MDTAQQTAISVYPRCPCGIPAWALAECVRQGSVRDVACRLRPGAGISWMVLVNSHLRHDDRPPHTALPGSARCSHTVR